MVDSLNKQIPQFYNTDSTIHTIIITSYVLNIDMNYLILPVLNHVLSQR